MLLPSSTRKTIPCLSYYIQGQCQCNPTAGSRVDAVLDILRGVAVMNIQSKQKQQLPIALVSEIRTGLHGFATSAPIAFVGRSKGCRYRSTLWQTCSLGKATSAPAEAWRYWSPPLARHWHSLLSKALSWQGEQGRARRCFAGQPRASFSTTSLDGRRLATQRRKTQ